MKKVLIDGATATDATKVSFNLTNDDFNGTPVLRSSGLGAGDVVTIWENVNGTWEDSGVVLDDTTKSLTVESVGTYAVSIVLTTAGPVTVMVESSGIL